MSDDIRTLSKEELLSVEQSRADLLKYLDSYITGARAGMGLTMERGLLLAIRPRLDWMITVLADDPRTSGGPPSHGQPPGVRSR